jgi:hypothetical protein
MQNLIKALRKAAIAGGITLALIFLFGPLFSKSFRQYLQSIKWLERLKAHLLLFWEILQQFIQSLLDVLRGDKSVGEIFAQGEEETAKNRKRKRGEIHNRIKKVELDRLSRQLEKLFVWARKQKYPYYSHETIDEFFERLLTRSQAAPIREDLKSIESIFEEARYSPGVVGRKKRREFAGSIKKVIAFRIAGDRTSGAAP